MKEKEVSGFVTWAAGRLVVPFMESRKGSRFGLEDYKFNHRCVGFELPGFTQRMSGMHLVQGL